MSEQWKVRILHENVTMQVLKKKRRLIVVRAMPIHSREMGVSGECDVVEFHKAKDGISLSGKEGFYKVVPIEYKRGKPKTDDSDILQVTAQALCLEEMLCCTIPYGYIYYGETKHRAKVEFTMKYAIKSEKYLRKCTSITRNVILQK